MRILHTSDWHLGRSLEGRDRQDEQEKFIDELISIVRDENIRCVLVAGDVFDSVNPPARAEELYYDALERLSEGGIRAVIVAAGNHDSPERLCAVEPLALRYGIILSGKPGETFSPDESGRKDRVHIVEGGAGWCILRIPRCDADMALCTLPFPTESRMNQVFSSLNEGEKDNAARFASCISDYIGRGCECFSDSTVNLFIGHFFVGGSMESESERPIQLGGTHLVPSSLLPGNAHYCALGHLHIPQEVRGSNVPARYSGSPLAYSFSEAGVAKSVICVDISPGRSAVPQEIVLSSGRPLVRWQASGLEEVHRWLDEGKDGNAWIDLEISLSESLSISDLRKLKEKGAGIVNIRPVFQIEEPLPAERRSQLPLDRLFIEFYRKQKKGSEPTEDVIRLFMRLVNDETTDSMEVNCQ
ncbi:MAG: exonuclease SbcCD subunit D [Candidatus Xenobiia bacterium LiM19]